jgi:hypothetical protein
LPSPDQVDHQLDDEDPDTIRHEIPDLRLPARHEELVDFIRDTVADPEHGGGDMRMPRQRTGKRQRTKEQIRKAGIGEPMNELVLDRKADVRERQAVKTGSPEQGDRIRDSRRAISPEGLRHWDNLPPPGNGGKIKSGEP